MLGKFIQASFDYYPERDDKFKEIAYFIDTNILFCALGLDFAEFMEPVNELLENMRFRGLKLFVLDITVAEAKRVLKNCIKGHDHYEKSVKVNSICAFLRNIKNLDNDGVRDVMRNLENKIEEKCIKIIKTEIDIRPKWFNPKDKDIINEMARYKPMQPPVPRNHDIAALEWIKSSRGWKSITRFDRCRTLFLTADLRLSRFNFEYEHEVPNTIPEVIRARSLATLLWINNPNIKLSLKSLMANCCCDLFINKKIWSKFLNVYNDLKRDGKLTEDDYLALIYNGYIENVLASYDYTETKEVTPELVMGWLTDAKLRMAKMVKIEIRDGLKKSLMDLRTILIAFVIFDIVALIYSIHIAGPNFILSIGLLIMIIALLVLSGVGFFGPIWESLINRLIEYRTRKE